MSRTRLRSLALAAACWLMVAAAPRATAASGDIQVQGRRPELVFACELDTAKLQALFADPALIPELQQLQASIALAIQDLSPERADVVRRLNAAGVPVIAWMALPREQGYYLNAGNEPAAAERFAQFESWTAQNRLRWAAIGLDVEPSLTEWGDIQGHRWRIVLTFLHRVFDGKRVERAREAYAGLIARMQAHGYSVQTYQLLFLADERRAHSTILERLFGLVDVRGNQETLMVYSSFNHALDGALIWAYGPDAQTIAVGSTAGSGDAAIDARFPPLDWKEFSRDLLIASHFSPVVGVYSLEGCVRQGFLPRLTTLNWQSPVILPAQAVTKAQRFRRIVQTALWLASHMVYLAIIFAAGVGWLVMRRRGKIARRSDSQPDSC
ncbi:MAG TPA: hypothetical protein VMG31_16435 [Verrucomicrobiae bacterium]|nr:hypothetical protein [Verrucomicrobiae bacterium]